MRFVGVKSPDQATMMLHRVRKILTRQRTQLSNALRTHMAKFGIIAATGRGGLERLIAVIAEQDDARLPDEAFNNCRSGSRSRKSAIAFSRPATARRTA